MKTIAKEEKVEKLQELQKLRSENTRLKKFIEIEKKIGTERNIDHLLPLIMTEISRFLDADRSALFLLDWDRMELWTKFAEGLKEGEIRIELKMGIVGFSVLSKKLVNVSNAYEDPRFNSEFDKYTGYRTESVLAFPIFSKDGEARGAIELLNKKTGVFTKADEQKAAKTALSFSEMGFSRDEELEKVQEIIYRLRQSIRCDRGSLFLLDKEKGTLYSKVSEGLDIHEIRLGLTLGAAGLAAITSRELNIPDAQNSPLFDQRTDKKTGYRTRCILCAPIKNKSGEVFGVIQVINKKKDTFSSADLDNLKVLSSNVAISLENAILFHEQHRQFKSVLKVMADSIEAKDPLTAGHSERVTRISEHIARELGFAENQIDVISVAALLHDYGKLGIDDKVLKKEGKLTKEEYEHIKSHVVFTKNILDKMYLSRMYRGVPAIASGHHERIDGSGYAWGKKGKDTPFMARIIAVADVFEALTAKRCYREALSAEEAFDIINRDTGSKFDENIVEALKAYLEKEGILKAL